MTNTAPTTGAVAWQRLGRVTGVVGMATVVLIFVVLVRTREEPPVTATADEFLTHYRSPNTVASDTRSFAFTVALVTFVWFVVALSTSLRRVEGEAPGGRPSRWSSACFSWRWSCPETRASIQRDRPDPGHRLFGQATSRGRQHPPYGVSRSVLT
jgi:hypothetical protein